VVPVDGIHVILRKSYKNGDDRGPIFMNATLGWSEGSQAVDFFDTGIQKLIPPYVQSPISGDGYVEK
jgi:hypothetical protein